MSIVIKHANEQDALVSALRQYRHNDGEGFVFGYDKNIADQIIAALTEGRDRQQAMKVKAQEQQHALTVMLDEMAKAAEEVIRISDRKHDAWDAAKAVIAKVRPIAHAPIGPAGRMS